MASGRERGSDAAGSTGSRVPAVLLASVAAVVAFLASASFFMSDGYTIVMMTFGFAGALFLQTPLCLITLHAVVAACAFAVVYQCARNRFNTKMLGALFVLYLVATFVLIMLKSRGVRGVNLDVLDIVGQLAASPLTVAANLLILLPLGAVVRRAVRSRLSALALGLGLVLVCEAAQYVFSLGIFDVVDILLNVAGFMGGYLLVDAAARRGVRLRRIDGSHCRIEVPSRSGRHFRACG